MPHATTGTAHACPGASGPVSLKNGNVIPAGNCVWTRMSGRRGWCRKHEHYCQLHDWTYSKKDECKHCVSAKSAKKKEEDQARKKKRDDDDDEGRKAPRKTRRGGLGSLSKETATPSPRKTRSMTKKEEETKGAPKAEL
ncbi:hypothetical protein IFR05_006763 [Cadophora sp. M221]|nr:hypothetical protein IFR05_006763 [Cadophora sp. M221]